MAEEAEEAEEAKEAMEETEKSEEVLSRGLELRRWRRNTLRWRRRMRGESDGEGTDGSEGGGARTQGESDGGHKDGSEGGGRVGGGGGEAEAKAETDAKRKRRRRPKRIAGDEAGGGS